MRDLEKSGSMIVVQGREMKGLLNQLIIGVYNGV